MTRKRNPYSSEIVARLLELGRLAYGTLPARPNLTRSQWAALRYFSQANAHSRTSTAFTRFQATTAGTVSQTIKGLVRRGLLHRRRSTTDRRTVYLSLTDTGWETLKKDPAEPLDRAAAELTAEQAAAVADGLTALAVSVGREQLSPVFGFCRHCRHFDVERTTVDGLPKRICRLLDVQLEANDTTALCVSFESPDEGG